jgi:hypothetical protein
VATYAAYPVNRELRKIEQELLPRLMRDREVFNFFPTRTVDTHLLGWEQKDNYLGLQQVRGLNGEPPRVKRIGHKQYLTEPGVYGEFVSIDEQELTTRRQMATYDAPIQLGDLVTEAQEQLLQRELDRIESIVWTLLATGTFAVATAQGGIAHTDSYTTQTFTAGVTWATFATSTPLANFRSVQLLSRGKGVKFGAQALAYMNRATFNNLISTTNSADLAGRRTSGLNTVLNLNETNSVLMGEDLPTIRIYDDGYLDDAGSFTLFVPNNKVIVIGQRPNNAEVGEYRFTRNVNNRGFAPGPYTMVEDTLDANNPPRKLQVHRGHNGGPVIYYPSAVVVMTV